MWERHLRYLEHYDFMDSIMDLNFYLPTSNKGMTVSARRGIRPYAGGIDWIGAKRIFVVMNMNKTHFMTLEILLHEGRMNVYGCNLMSRWEPMVKNNTNATCGSYSLAFIEHFIINTTIQPLDTTLCDNTVGRIQWNWDAGIVSRILEP
ncbi:hypothetical protein H5410_046255 [Solanum commersonii]|uniref:Ubiquitin-like protease family profile domain-containing protein n=1 Tax=Solanum commersonii TaxID=4109 RepID=A0A9J5XDV0_SOLCO|nr:hypothetical protein H5410_046255 [Solanum commersonii]